MIFMAFAVGTNLGASVVVSRLFDMGLLKQIEAIAVPSIMQQSVLSIGNIQVIRLRI